ncbi:DUF72 domain-containing protein [Salisediminibacterium beveridgei]|uniref:DUF72 domain-containing protein n=1 Tax=Salisediminibacterium beveridgei TaxID=632773 RepID=A0A1D7QSN0_9BACI|nr:DUF72 domain-containing protein [Salisediminibacterium beveridgei]AOM82016.1 hypothetical protein BBEV_0624 [Salisediminibacterium beveridgei]
MKKEQLLIGCTGWGDHDTLYETPGSAGRKLQTYASHFPIVELDATFYAIPNEQTVQKWIAETPDIFQFVVKAYQGMTGHQREENPFSSQKAMFDAFDTAMAPMRDAGKLAMILFQFPPWFTVTKERVNLLRGIRERYRDYDLALEFRHQSWFSDEMREKTLSYMRADQWIHSICDEPQAGEKSIPCVPEPTSSDKSLVRLHGRNTGGWTYPSKGEEWRDVRYLYEYNRAELEELSQLIQNIHEQVGESYVVFNNNSGGHAAQNAKQVQEILGITYTGLFPRQINLF